MRTVYGVHPVRELVRADAAGLAELWVADGTRRRDLAEIERLARAAGAKVRSAPRPRLDRLAGTDRHQGVVAVVAEYRYRDLGDILEAARSRGEPPLVVVLDGIEDPQNLGAIVRSAHVLGGHGVVIAKDRAAGVTAAAAKASAGAVELCPVARVTNVAKALADLREEGVWSMATAADGERLIEEVDLTGPAAIVVGGEADGIRPLVRRTCDFAARIPMRGELGSLSASAAAAIALHEAARQRRGAAGGQRG